jgi:MFS family permease
MSNESPAVGLQTEVPPAQSGETKGWNARLVLSLVSLTLVSELIAINYFMMATALPFISAAYHTDQLAWVNAVFLLLGAVASPLLGRLADLHGKRRLLLISVSGAAVGSVISALAPSFALLLVGRTLQGLLVPCLFLAYSLIRDVYPPKTVALAVSVLGAGTGLVAVPCPWLTAWLLGLGGAHAIFWFFAIALGVLWVAVIASTKETPVRVSARLDFVGAALLGLGLCGVLIAISFGPQWGWVSSKTLAFFGLGVLLIAGWFLSALRVPEPLVDVRSFRRPSILVTATVAGLASSCAATTSTLLPLLCMTPSSLGLGYGFGVTPKGFALFLLPFGVGGVVGGFLVGFAVRLISPAYVMVAGQMLMAAGAGFGGIFDDSRPLMYVWTLIAGLGLGLSYAAVPNLVIAAVSVDQQAAMAGMVQVFQNAFAAVLPVVAFTILNSHIALHIAATGAVVYSNTGFHIAFMLAAAAGIASACFALSLRALRTAT